MISDVSVSNSSSAASKSMPAFSQNKAYLAFAYANKDTYTPQNKTQYYNVNDKHEKKKKRLKKIAIGTTVAISTAAVLGAVFKNKHGDFSKLLKKADEFSLKDSKILDSVGNVWSNINNIKDDVWDKYIAQKTKNVPILSNIDRFGQWITNVYRKGAKTCFQGDYTKALKELQELASKEGVDLSHIKNYDDIFNSLNSEILETLQKNRVTKGLLKEGKTIDRAKDLFSKVTKSNIADGKITNLTSVQDLTQDIKLDGEISKELTQSLEKFNNIRRKTAANLIPKLRDINAGSAPTDMLTIIMSTIGLGVTVALTKDKQERKSIVTNIGIPLLGTLGCNVIMTLKCITGAPAMIFSLAMGQVAKAGAKLLTKATADNIEV